ncbi:MAG: hypothetical protein MJ252_10200, partial [archaeon]|nr:hypothetical protein [archaeon]
MQIREKNELSIKTSLGLSIKTSQGTLTQKEQNTNQSIATKDKPKHSISREINNIISSLNLSNQIKNQIVLKIINTISLHVQEKLNDNNKMYDNLLRLAENKIRHFIGEYFNMKSEILNLENNLVEVLVKEKKFEDLASSSFGFKYEGINKNSTAKINHHKKRLSNLENDEPLLRYKLNQRENKTKKNEKGSTILMSGSMNRIQLSSLTSQNSIDIKDSQNLSNKNYLDKRNSQKNIFSNSQIMNTITSYQCKDNNNNKT